MTLNEQLQANIITALEIQLQDSKDDNCLLEVKNDILERQLQAYKDALDFDKAGDIYRGSWVNTLEGIVEMIDDQAKRNLK